MIGNRPKVITNLALVLAVVLLLGSAAGIVQLGNLVQPAYANNTSTSSKISQCVNGGVDKPSEPCRITGRNDPLGTLANWVNGNANAQKAHWKEGEKLPQRAIITGLSGSASDTYTIRIYIDTVKASKHALDQFSSYDATETTSTISVTAQGAADGTSPPFPVNGHANHNNPCLDVSGVSCSDPAVPADSFAIPAPTLVDCNGSTHTGSPSSEAGDVKLFATGGDLTGVAYAYQNVIDGDRCKTALDISFKTTGSSAVIAVGARIAAQFTWGTGNSAISITGSPYHIHLEQICKNSSTNCDVIGNQDNQLTTAAVIFTPSVITTIIDEATGLAVTDNNGNGIPDITVGSAGTVTVHDTATMTGASPTAAGTATYNFYSGNSACGTVTPTSQAVNVANGAIPNSSSKTLGAGSYSYNAKYNGDSVSHTEASPTSACEPLEVLNPPQGTIVIKKVTVPSSAASTLFTFTDDFKDRFGNTIDNDPDTSGTQTTFNLDTDAATTTISFQRSFEVGTSPLGPYSTSETNIPVGWTLTGSSCNDSDSTPSSINVATGETVTCTFTDKSGDISWVKQDNTGALQGGATFQVCGTTTGARYQASGEGCATVADNGALDKDSVAGQFKVDTLSLGTYSITETVAPTGFALDTTVGHATVTDSPDDSYLHATSDHSPFVDNRPVVKITGFGYDNAAAKTDGTNLCAADTPTSGVLDGCATYTIKLHNYGGAAGTVDLTLSITEVTTGTLTQVDPSTGASISSCPCTILMTTGNGNAISLAANGDTTVTVKVRYENTDNTKISADLTVNYTPTGGSGTSAASGSGANITFTVQGD